ncbi:hypothetical protein D3C84_1191060 [compost metagenome]
MMHVMEANIARYPLQQAGKLIVGASFNSGLHVAPLIVILEVGILELMLNIE